MKEEDKYPMTGRQYHHMYPTGRFPYDLSHHTFSELMQHLLVLQPNEDDKENSQQLEMQLREGLQHAPEQLQMCIFPALRIMKQGNPIGAVAKARKHL
jgi:hypothetical protein